MKRSADPFLKIPGAIVSASPILRAGLRLLLVSALPGLKIREYEAIPSDVELQNPDPPSIQWCILADSGRPDQPFADWAGVKRLRLSGVSIVALVPFLSVSEIKHLKNFGVTEFLGLDAAGLEIVAALRRTNKRYASGELAVPKHRFAKLSQAELHVATCIVEGDSLKEIAVKLGLSAKTVSSYKSRIMVKLDVENNAELFRRLEPLVAWMRAEHSSGNDGVPSAGGG
jgi:DNA-binding NarL/FixJ family response regulator